MIPMLTQETIEREMAEAERELCGAHDRCFVVSESLERALASLGADGFCQIGSVKNRETSKRVWLHVDTGVREYRDPPKVPMWFRDPVSGEWRQTEPR